MCCGQAASGIETENNDCCADWDLNLVRYWFIDYENGNDANLGYLDAAPGTVFIPASIQAIALKTIEEVQNRIPRNGAGRRTVILIRGNPDGTTQVEYFRKDGTTRDWIDRSGYIGYATMIWRASDFTNSSADQLRCATQNAVNGPNADGSFTVQSYSAPNITIAAGAFSTTFGDLNGRSLEFKGNVTAALATKGGIVKGIRSTSVVEAGIGSTSTLTSPANGDEFFVRRPSILIAGVVGTDLNSTTPQTATGSTSYLGGSVIAGFQWDGFSPTFGSSNSLRMTLNNLVCAKTLITGFTVIRFSIGTGIKFAGQYANETGITVDTGHTLGAIGAPSLNFAIAGGGSNVPSVTSDQLLCIAISSVGAQSSILTLHDLKLASALGVLSRSGIFGNILAIGCSFGGRHTIAGQGLGGVLGAGDRIWCRRTLTGTGAGIATRNCQMRIDFAVIGDCANGVDVDGSGWLYLKNVIQDPDFANTGFGIDVSPAFRCIVDIDVATNVTGNSGNIRLAGPAVASYAGLALTNVVDSAGNNISGPAGNVVDSCKFVSNQSGGTLAVGDLVRSNGTGNQVTSSQADTAANCPVVGVMVTSPASGAGGYMAPPGGTPVVNFDGAPTVGAIAYVSPGTARAATTTVPAMAATNQKLRIGRPIQQVSGTLFRTAFAPEWLPVLADGLA